MPACPRKHAVALAACLGLGCQPMEATLAMVACPRGMPWPLLRALALAACPRGIPWPWLPAHGGSLGCCMPRPWQLARWGLPWSWLHAVSLALALAADCPHIWSDFLKIGVFVKLMLFPSRRRARGIPGACPRAHHAASPRIVMHSSKIGSCLCPFLCS